MLGALPAVPAAPAPSVAHVSTASAEAEPHAGAQPTALTRPTHLGGDLGGALRGDLGGKALGGRLLQWALAAIVTLVLALAARTALGAIYGKWRRGGAAAIGGPLKEEGIELNPASGESPCFAKGAAASTKMGAGGACAGGAAALATQCIRKPSAAGRRAAQQPTGSMDWDEEMEEL